MLGYFGNKMLGYVRNKKLRNGGNKIWGIEYLDTSGTECCDKMLGCVGNKMLGYSINKTGYARNKMLE